MYKITIRDSKQGSIKACGVIYISNYDLHGLKPYNGTYLHHDLEWRVNTLNPKYKFPGGPYDKDDSFTGYYKDFASAIDTLTSWMDKTQKFDPQKTLLDFDGEREATLETW